ncbi:hypothetical protein GQ55_8G250200 [Panicum hallii var. hallii]|nr:hypothetical protein GQ55_8G250200 [Panicum hallii var. hallii]
MSCSNPQQKGMPLISLRVQRSFSTDIHSVLRSCGLHCSSGMADPVASVETIVRIALAISKAVGTAQRNIDQCKDVQAQVSVAKDSLLVLQRKGLMDDKGSAVGRALGHLKTTLRRALELVRACQKEDQSFVQRVLRAEDLSSQLRQVKQDILQELSMATFAINAHMAPDAHHDGQRQLQVQHRRHETPAHQKHEHGQGKTPEHRRITDSEHRRTKTSEHRTTKTPECRRNKTPEHRTPNAREHRRATDPEHRRTKTPEHRQPTRPEHRRPKTPERRRPDTPKHQRPDTSEHRRAGTHVHQRPKMVEKQRPKTPAH